MNTKNRTFIPVDERIKFTKKNKGIVERHFPHDNRYKDIVSDFNIYLDYGFLPCPQDISLSFIYLDLSKASPPFDSFEFIKTEHITFPQVEIGKKSEMKIPVKMKDQNLLLWKIRYEANIENEELGLHSTISIL